MEKKRSVWRFIGKYPTLILLVVMVLAFSIFTKGFATPNNFFNLLRQCAIMGILAVGESIVIISGGIDLSVGASLAVCTVVTAKLVVTVGLNPVAAALIGILICVVIGLVNGLVITYTDMPPFIGTLAMMQVLSGIAFIVTKGMPIYGLPNKLKQLGQGYFGPVPIPVLILVLVFAFAIFLMSRTYYGRYFFAVGSNQEAARLSGLHTKRIRILAYAICGFFVGVAGLITMARIGAGQANAGAGIEMDVITACVLGGVSMAGGIGKMPLVAVGTIIMGVISNGLGVMGVSTYGQMVCKGLILIAVVSADSIKAKFSSVAE